MRERRMDPVHGPELVAAHDGHPGVAIEAARRHEPGREGAEADGGDLGDDEGEVAEERGGERRQGATQAEPGPAQRAATRGTAPPRLSPTTPAGAPPWARSHSTSAAKSWIA